MASHSPACARRLRALATTQRWDIEETIEQIRRCCGVSRLRAHRLARGWTLAQAVNEYRRMCQGRPDAAKLDADQLGRWETGTHRPRTKTVDLLCQLYATNAQGLDLAGDYAPETTRLPHISPLTPARTPFAPSTDDSLQTRSEQMRRRMDRTLAQATITPGQLDLLDERLIWLRHHYIVEAPASMVELLLAELDEVHTLATQRQPATIQSRLNEITAVLATLTADAHMKLGQLRHAHGWYGTALSAADDSNTTELRARVRAQAAMLPYYYGPLASAKTLAQHARMLSHHSPNAIRAFAAAAEARTCARLGDKAGAQQAINIARDHFDRCDHGPEGDALAFPERRLLLYLSGAYTHLGQTDRARQAQYRALALYPDHNEGIDPALLRLEQAICLARERSLTEACQLAEDTYLGVPDPHRTPILIARARHVIEVLPPRMRSARAVRNLGEALEISVAVE